MNDQFLTKKQVIAATTRSATSLWRDVKAGRFPAPFQIGPMRIAWRKSDVEKWMNQQIVVGGKSA